MPRSRETGGNFLEKILATKKIEVAAARKLFPAAELLRGSMPAPASFKSAIQKKGAVSLIAEIKRASPSKGVMRENFDPLAIARVFEENGAAALSVLTDKTYFHGDLEYLRQVRGMTRLPLLRKDFIIDEYQVAEARATGANAVLLIVAALEGGQLADLMSAISAMGMEALVEVHHLAELETALAAGASMIGINNRDLKTFKVDVNTTRVLRPRIPAGVAVVSASGIRSRQDIELLRDMGVDAALIGEAFMSAPVIGDKIQELFP